MKRTLTLLMLFALILPCSVTAQNSHHSTFNDFSFGVSFGASLGKYVPIEIYGVYKSVLFGLDVAFPFGVGREGELYTVINWDEMSEDHKKEGKYYTPILFNLGYRYKKFTFTAGFGAALLTKYRNCYDNTHILGDNGAYYKEVRSGSEFDFKVGVSYLISRHVLIKLHYGLIENVGLSIGFEI